MRDAWEEVLRRVDAVTLARCACACREFRGLAAPLLLQRDRDLAERARALVRGVYGGLCEIAGLAVGPGNRAELEAYERFWRRAGAVSDDDEWTLDDDVARLGPTWSSPVTCSDAECKSTWDADFDGVRVRVRVFPSHVEDCHDAEVVVPAWCGVAVGADLWHSRYQWFWGDALRSEGGLARLEAELRAATDFRERVRLLRAISAAKHVEERTTLEERRVVRALQSATAEASLGRGRRGGRRGSRRACGGRRGGRSLPPKKRRRRASDAPPIPAPPATRPPLSKGDTRPYCGPLSHVVGRLAAYARRPSSTYVPGRSSAGGTRRQSTPPPPRRASLLWNGAGTGRPPLTYVPGRSRADGTRRQSKPGGLGAGIGLGIGLGAANDDAGVGRGAPGAGRSGAPARVAAARITDSFILRAASATAASLARSRRLAMVACRRRK